MTVAFHTLGCKVNQYDTQAMRELMAAAGYTPVSFQSSADIYVLNTCTVTGVGDHKSLQMARRIRRQHPDSLLVLCGCMAQKQGERLLKDTGAHLVLGTQFRGEIVSLIGQVLREGKPVCAVSPFPPALPFEPLNISEISGHTRASIKIQEGCGNRCTYCIIPSVRGPIRSRSLEDLTAEVLRLRGRGFSEIVLTGIHLASYGQEIPGRPFSLLDAIRCVHEVDGIERIRLGSLEPLIASDSFCRALKDLPKVCPQFHLALQSGSDTVLQRMKRRYNTSQYLAAVDRIREIYPLASLTTDILTGFPGETESEFQETCRIIGKVGFSRIHVFPYSPREDTPAAAMSGQLSAAEKERRVRELIGLGRHAARQYLSSWLNRESVVLAEKQTHGCWEGYTPEYIRVTLPPGTVCQSGLLLPVRLTGFSGDGMSGEPVLPSCPSRR